MPSGLPCPWLKSTEGSGALGTVSTLTASVRLRRSGSLYICPRVPYTG